MVPSLIIADVNSEQAMAKPPKPEESIKDKFKKFLGIGGAHGIVPVGTFKPPTKQFILTADQVKVCNKLILKYFAIMVIFLRSNVFEMLSVFVFKKYKIFAK